MRRVLVQSINLLSTRIDREKLPAGGARGDKECKGRAAGVRETGPKSLGGRAGRLYHRAFHSRGLS
jgi:hypothetical protein